MTSMGERTIRTKYTNGNNPTGATLHRIDFKRHRANNKHSKFVRASQKEIQNNSETAFITNTRKPRVSL